MGNADDKRKDELKIIVLGDSGCGKSAFLRSLCGDPFQTNSTATLGVDIRPISLEIDDELVNLQLWDTAGQEKYRSTTQQYIRDAHGIFVIYDCTTKSSFTTVSEWIQLLKKFGAEDTPFVLIGNKSDLKDKRAVSCDEGREVAQRYEVKFMDVSVKEGRNTKEAAAELVREIRRRMANASTSVVEERVMSSVTKTRSTVSTKRKEGGMTVTTVTKTKESVHVREETGDKDSNKCGCTIQ